MVTFLLIQQGTKLPLPKKRLLGVDSRNMATPETLLPVFITILLVTSFVKCVTALSIFRYGIGLQGAEFGLLIVVVALGLSVASMPEPIEKVGGIQVLFGGSPSPDFLSAVEKTIPILTEKTPNKILSVFKRPEKGDGSSRAAHGDASLRALQEVLPAYLVSELTTALSIGCLLLIPFLVVDIAVSHVLALIGAPHMSASAVALPLKLLLFLAVDGWSLLAQRLLGL
jgi:flagellar biosynthesis protein FliP